MGIFRGNLPPSLVLLSLFLHTVTFLPTLFLPKLAGGDMCRARLMTDTRGKERSPWLPVLRPPLEEKHGENPVTSHGPAFQHLSAWSVCSAEKGTNSDLILAFLS